MRRLSDDPTLAVPGSDLHAADAEAGAHRSDGVRYHRARDRDRGDGRTRGDTNGDAEAIDRRVDRARRTRAHLGDGRQRLSPRDPEQLVRRLCVDRSPAFVGYRRLERRERGGHCRTLLHGCLRVVQLPQ